MPLATMPSAMDLMRSSLTLQPNLFQEFQPIGGVWARPLSRAVEGWTKESKARSATAKNKQSRAVNVFIGKPPGRKIAVKSYSKRNVRERQTAQRSFQPTAQSPKELRR